MENIEQKAKDDQDFLYTYGSVRSRTPTQEYRENYDRIFNKPHLIESTSVETTPVSGA